MIEGVPLVAILAAGWASRFGGGKLDAECAGKPLGQWVCDAVATAGIAPGIIVTGVDRPAFAQAAEGLGWTLVDNVHAAEGLATSIAAAARHAQGAGASALVLLLADMPLVDAAMIATLHAAKGGESVATRYANGRPGVPACLPAALFPALAGLSGDRGAASLLAGLPDLRLIDPAPGALTDVDDAAGLTCAAQLLAARIG